MNGQTPLAYKGLVVLAQKVELLGDLLAIIHRNGGRYHANIGTAKSVEDAIKVIAAMRSAHEQCIAENND